MGLNIKNPEVERLATERAEMAGETKTEAIRKALLERRDRLALGTVASRGRGVRLRSLLEAEVWPQLAPGERGRRLTREERERILGYGPEGV